MGKAYKNTILGFRKWCKDHPWNVAYESEAGYKRFEDYFVEFSLSENRDGSLTAYKGVRVYSEEKKSFRVAEEVIEPWIVEQIDTAFEEYAEKHNATPCVV